MKHLKIFYITIVFLITGCNIRGNNVETLDPKTVIDVEEKTILVEENNICDEKNNNGVDKENSEMDETVNKYIVAIPEQNRYMFESGICEGSLPDKSEIKKIALSKINKPSGGNGIYFVIYGVIDFENKKSSYALCKEGPLMEPQTVQEFELTDEDIERYLSAFEKKFLKDEVQFGTGWWKIAVEYENGICYAYDIREAGLKNNTPENDMIKAYFDKMELSDSDRLYSSLFE